MPMVCTCDLKIWGHLWMHLFSFSSLKLLRLTINICPVSENRGGNQSWFRWWEDVQRLRPCWMWKRTIMIKRCSNGFHRTQTSTTTAHMFLFFWGFFLLSFSLSKMNITLFHPSSRIICSIWREGEAFRQATARRAASQVQALLEEYHVAAFYDLFNTRRLNAAICPVAYDTVWMQGGEHCS